MSKRPRKTRADEALPPWIGDDQALQAFTIAELDKADAAFDRQMAEDAANFVHMMAMRTPEAEDFLVNKVGLSRFPRSKTESLKRHLTIGKRAAAEHNELLEQRAIEEGNIEALRRLHPKLAQYINSPKGKRGRPRRISHDLLSPEDRLREAVHDLRRIRDLWKEKLGHSNRPTGHRGDRDYSAGRTSLTAAKIAAERWGLDESDVLKRRVSRKTRERLARQR
jgi:hypothetical protein